MRELIEICRELELRRIHLVIGFVYSVIGAAIVFVCIVLMLFVLTGIQDAVIHGRG